MNIGRTLRSFVVWASTMDDVEEAISKLQNKYKFDTMRTNGTLTYEGQ